MMVAPRIASFPTAAQLTELVNAQRAQSSANELIVAGTLPPPPIGPIPNPPRDMTPGERSAENMQVVGVLGTTTVAGATIGTAVLGPGVGTVVGAAGGAIVGLVGSWFLAKNNEDSRRRR